MPLEQCVSEYRGIRCDVVTGSAPAPHTHHGMKDETQHLWWSDSDVIAELKEKLENLIETNDLKLT